MPRNQQFDSVEYTNLDFPYNRILGELNEEPHLVYGLNSYCSPGSKLIKRPGTLEIDEALVKIAAFPYQLWIYETLDNPPRVYLIGSFQTVTTFEMFYIRLDASPAPTQWTSMGSLRGLNASVFPHAAVAKRGLFYMKSFPLPGVDPEELGSVLFDGSASGGGPTTRLWGLTGPTVPASLSDPTTWPASDHPVTVSNGWAYTYCWVTTDGQVSNRVALQSNPDKNPSVVDAFTNKIPQVTVTGHPDTTNVPFVNIYRTTDGGGTFFFLKQVANPGGTTFLFEDKYLESGATGGVFNDPLPDADLDTTQVAPTLTSNSPPPTVTAPLITGVSPIAQCSPPVEYAGRIWYAIGEHLFYSGLEEIAAGIPEDCWPSGTQGNFFQFQYPIMNLTSTSDALYIHTLQATYRVTGTNKETFNPRPFLASIGAPYGHPKARAVIGESVVWLTHDFRIAVISPSGAFSIITDPLFTDISDAVTAGGEIELSYWGALDKEWLIVASNRSDNTLESRQWVYDLKKSQVLSKDFWNAPWSIRTVSMASGRINESSSLRRLVFGIWDGTQSTLVRIDPTARTGTDFLPDGTESGYTVAFNTQLTTIPPGNHFNNLRKPAASPVAHALLWDRSVFPGDQDPKVYFYLDDFWTDPCEILNPTAPWRRQQSKAYKSSAGNINRACKRIAVRFQKTNTKDLFELHAYAIVFNPEGGA